MYRVCLVSLALSMQIQLILASISTTPPLHEEALHESTVTSEETCDDENSLLQTHQHAQETFAKEGRVRAVEGHSSYSLPSDAVHKIISSLSNESKELPNGEANVLRVISELVGNGTVDLMHVHSALAVGSARHITSDISNTTVQEDTHSSSAGHPTTRIILPHYAIMMNGRPGTNHCPANSVPASRKECNPKYDVGSNPNDPKGCFKYGNDFYYNTHPRGRAVAHRIPYCRFARWAPAPFRVKCGWVLYENAGIFGPTKIAQQDSSTCDQNGRQGPTSRNGWLVGKISNKKVKSAVVFATEGCKAFIYDDNKCSSGEFLTADGTGESGKGRMWIGNIPGNVRARSLKCMC